MTAAPQVAVIFGFIFLIYGIIGLYHSNFMLCEVMMLTGKYQTPETLHPATRLGSVSLTVSDLPRALDFYQRTLGLQVHYRQGQAAGLGAGVETLLQLIAVPGALRHPRTSGLYHFALLVPSRLELARVLHNLTETIGGPGGASDHLVSEALYLSDPDGNGIEIYRDRPRDQWPLDQGQIRMAVDPLDFHGLMAELESSASAWPGMHPDTVLGHMHLHVADLNAALAFYTRVVGLDLMALYGGSAAFLSAGGYHHHLGINTWNGIGAPPPPPDSVGLRHFSVLLPNSDDRERLESRLNQNHIPFERRDGSLVVQDPSENSIHFVSFIE
jgi:catechol 2,3-dioxygenase